MAVLGEIAIVVQPRDLQPVDIEPAALQRRAIGHAEALKGAHLHRLDAGDLVRCGVDSAEINRLAEGKIIGMKQTAPAVGQIAIAQNIEQLALDVAAEVIGGDADMQVDFQRDELRLVDFEIVPRHAVALDVIANVGLELLG